MDMNKLQVLYEQYNLLKENLKRDDGFTNNLQRYGITEDYYNKVNQAVELLCKYYIVKLDNSSIRNALSYRLNDNHSENTKICLIIDVLRCYEGLGHPTTFTTPEGVALLIFLDKMLGNKEITSFLHLEAVSAATVSLIDIIPYISDCSESLGLRYSLYLPTIIAKKSPDMEPLYRRLIYNLCKTIAAVDGEITIAEQEWLNEIALLNDEDSNNDIDIKGL